MANQPPRWRELHPAAKVAVILLAVGAGAVALGCLGGLGKWAWWVLFRWTP